MQSMGYVLVFVSVFMSLFTFFHARRIFYATQDKTDKRVYLLLMIVCLIFGGLKWQDRMNGSVGAYPGPAVFYSIYNISIFVILIYVTGTQYDT